MQVQLVEKAKALYKTLKHEDGARTKTQFFYGLMYEDELTFGIMFLYEMSCPIMLICRGTGGECGVVTLESDTDKEIESEIQYFLYNHGIEITNMEENFI